MVCWIWFFLCCSIVNASELIGGQVYNSGDTIEISGIGVSFQIPAKWLGGLVDGGEGTILLGSNTEGGMLTVLTTRTSSPKQLLAEFNQPMPLEDGVVLVPTTQPKMNGERLTIEYSVTMNGVPMAEAFARMDGYIKTDGLGFGVLALGASTAQQQLVGRQQELISTTKFFVPKQPQELMGCWLNSDGYVSDGFSSTTSTKIVLEPSGRYQYSSKVTASLSSVDSSGDWLGDSSAQTGDGVETGTFYTIGNYVILQASDGERVLSYKSVKSGVFFNNFRYSRCQ